MGLYEVTQAQFQAVMGSNPSKLAGASRPVEMVTWTEAAEFCERLAQTTGRTVRLPTEAEWEYACRAGTKTRYSFGDNDADMYQYGNYADRTCTKPFGGPKDEAHSDGHEQTAPVGSFKPNPWGLYDMHGNVWEWCADRGADSYDPGAAAAENTRGLRGGCWNRPAAACRSAYRNRNAMDFRGQNIGFRVVVEVK